jgi:replicative DNA helicase
MPPNTKDGLTEDQIASLIASAAALRDLPIIWEDSAGITPTQMRAAARRVQRMPGGLGLIIGDYLQIFGIERGLRMDGPVQRVTYLSSAWKELCRALKVPGIVLSQLSRAVEQRENKRPMLSDLRESGTIEQDADVIMFLYQGKAEVIASKVRVGAIGSCVLDFDGPRMAFSDPRAGQGAPAAQTQKQFDLVGAT